MDTKRFSFTATRLERVEAPVSGSIYVYYTQVPGLSMRVTKGGARTFVYYKRIRGPPSRINLGPFRGMNIVDARRAAQQITGQIAAGIDVLAERRASKIKARTVGDAFRNWLRVAKHRKRTWKDDRSRPKRFAHGTKVLRRSDLGARTLPPEAQRRSANVR